MCCTLQCLASRDACTRCRCVCDACAGVPAAPQQHGFQAETWPGATLDRPQAEDDMPASKEDPSTALALAYVAKLTWPAPRDAVCVRAAGRVVLDWPRTNRLHVRAAAPEYVHLSAAHARAPTLTRLRVGTGTWFLRQTLPTCRHCHRLGPHCALRAKARALLCWSRLRT